MITVIKWCTFGFFAILILAIPVGSVCYRLSSEEVDITVTRTEAIVHNNQSKYLVYCDGEVFENVDTLIFLKWDSSDLYNDLKPGQYKVLVAGWRVPFLSWYRNIIEVVE